MTVIIIIIIISAPSIASLGRSVAPYPRLTALGHKSTAEKPQSQILTDLFQPVQLRGRSSSTLPCGL